VPRPRRGHPAPVGRSGPRAIRHEGEQEPQRLLLFADGFAQRLQATDQPARVEIMDSGRSSGLDGADCLHEGTVRAVAVAGGDGLGDVLSLSGGQHPTDQLTQALLVAGVEWSAGHERVILSVGQATADHWQALDARGFPQAGEATFVGIRRRYGCNGTRRDDKTQAAARQWICSRRTQACVLEAPSTAALQGGFGQMSPDRQIVPLPSACLPQSAAAPTALWSLAPASRSAARCRPHRIYLIALSLPYLGWEPDKRSLSKTYLFAIRSRVS